jgi:fructokinase
MIVVLGEILVDIFETYRRIGGAPFNFAFHLKQLSFPVRFVTRIGRDRWGDEIVELLARHQFDPEDVQIDAIHPTGTVRVTLDDQGVPGFDIRDEVAYDYIDFEAVDPILGPETRLIYYGTLAQRSDAAFERFERLLSCKEKRTISFCDINLRPPHVRWDVLESALRHADILKLNSDELNRIGDFLRREEGEPLLVRHLMERYDIDMLVLTRGASGSTIFRGGEQYDAPLPETGEVVDTVGAGDAFAAVIAAGYLRGLPLPGLLDAATRFAAGICSLPGAIPEDLSIYDRLRKNLEGAAHA